MFLAVALGATLFASAIGAYSAIQQGRQQNKLAQEQARMARNEAEINALTQEAEAAELQKQAARVEGAQVAAAASAGVTQNSGSVLKQVASTASKFEKDVQQLQRNARLSRAAGAVQANYYNQSGKFAQQAGYWQGGATLLDGISLASGTWANRVQ